MLWLLLLFATTFAERLGRQSGEQLYVETVDGFLQPDDFINNYMIPGKPVIFKGAAKSFPAFTKWTDEYFQASPHSVNHLVDVEEGKKENRNDESRIMSLSDFVDIYRDEDIYCVSSLPPFLAADLPIYKPLNCPFVLDNLLKDMVMWYSSGGTKSVWHNDAYENINCLFRGKKELVLANRTETGEKVHIDNLEGGFSTVNVDDVDVNKYPGFKDTQFYNASMEPGDCLYIPWLWFHQVNSFDRFDGCQN